MSYNSGMKIEFNLKLAIGILVGFGLLYTGFLAYEPIWFKVQELKLESGDTETRNSAIKSLAEKGETILPQVKKWLKSPNSALAAGACHILVLVKKYFEEPVKYIMLCPQGSGYPIFAVFEDKD